MRIKRPDSPFQASTEPIDPQQASDVSKLARGNFAEALSQLESAIDDSSVSQAGVAVSGPYEETRSALLEIANMSDLSDGEQAANAVRLSAQYMIRSRLADRFRESSQGRNLVENLGSYVAHDPLLKPKLLAILTRIKSE